MALVGEDLDAQHGVGLARSRITFGKASWPTCAW
jgi:hypothetical protein